MNGIQGKNFVEQVHRLALGLEPLDALNGGRLSHPVRVEIEGPLPRPPREPVQPYGLGPAGRWLPPRPGSYPRSGQGRPKEPFISRHDSCLHVLIFSTSIQNRSNINIRIYDHDRRYVPRRFSVPLRTLEEVLDQEDETSGQHIPFPERLEHRRRRPVLFPGAAYEVTETATGLRGRVIRNGEPMRWAQVEARLTRSNGLVGQAHGDDRGEFLLLLEPAASPVPELTDPLNVRIIVMGPGTAPVPDNPEVPSQDKFWDLPLEQLPEPGQPDPVSAADSYPDGFAISLSASREVPFRLGRILSGLEDFIFA